MGELCYTMLMLQAFANLPAEIADVIAPILSQPENSHWMSSAQKLHVRYMQREKNVANEFIQNSSDVLAYLGLRVPATYAQIYGTFLQIKEMLPAWEPKSLLKLGLRPRTGMWSATTLLA